MENFTILDYGLMLFLLGIGYDHVDVLDMIFYGGITYLSLTCVGVL